MNADFWSMNILSVKQYSMKYIMWNQWWKYTAFKTFQLLVYYTVFSLAGMYKTAEKSDLKKSLESHVKIQSGDCQLVSNTAWTLNAYLIWIKRKNEKKVQCFLASTILDVSRSCSGAAGPLDFPVVSLSSIATEK